MRKSSFFNLKCYIFIKSMRNVRIIAVSHAVEKQERTGQWQTNIESEIQTPEVHNAMKIYVFSGPNELLSNS